MSTLTKIVQEPSATPIHKQHELPHFARPHLTMSGLYLGAFLGMLSETAMSIALPALMDDFRISAGVAQWMIVGYMLAIGIVLPFVGLLLRSFNAKVVAQCALAISLIGAILSTCAPTFALVLTGRMLQGVGTGIILPTLFSAIIHIFPPHRIGAANGVAGLTIMLAPVIGPTLGGILVGVFSWRSLFAVFAIVAALALALITLRFVNPLQQMKQSVDAVSVAESIIGFGALICGVSLISEQGLSPLVILLIILGITSIALYSQRQLRINHPIMDISLLMRSDFRTPALIVTLSFACTLVCMYIVPLELQRGLALDSSYVGVMMLPAGVVNALCSFAAGRLYDTLGSAPLIRFGGVMTLIGIVMFMMIGTSTSMFFFVMSHIVIMVGIPFIQQPAQSAALASLPRQSASDGSTILNTLQQVIGAVGTALATCLLGFGVFSVSDPAQGFIAGSRYGYLFAAVLVGSALLISLLHRRVAARSAVTSKDESH
ncbi:MFS transporter [Schaalia sp. lx-100]|uniref:MFS transporter n=1 Tax=Schaalia sp. lx-100 TaxID=2899081 RepID=UPI001E420F63|nr:MFS transporter [Schaalia sp. lx-100]MCD4556658.1 MFS transporter [Schaalia sp. lx-100]